MKKVKSFFIVFILFVIKLNTNYATVSGNYTVSKTKNNGKMLFLLIGLVLIGMVLFLGYKMDKYEETNERKKKINNGEKKKVIKNYLSNIFSKINEIKENRKTNEKEETQTFTYDELENKKEIERDIIEYDDDLSSDIEDIDNLSNEEVLEENEKLKEENDESIDKPKIQNVELDAISNIFNQKNKAEENELSIRVKGYDFDLDDDFDLLDIEESIKEANIKKYTRKKDRNEKKEKQEKQGKKENKSILKRYTRKIDKNKDTQAIAENNIEEIEENKPKRYTRKIKTENKEIIEEKIQIANSFNQNKEIDNEDNIGNPKNAFNNNDNELNKDIDGKENNTNSKNNVENEDKLDYPDEMNVLSKIIDLGILDDIEDLEEKIHHNKIENGQIEIESSEDIEKAKNTKEIKTKKEKNKDIEDKKKSTKKEKKSEEETDLKVLLNIDTKKGSKKSASKKDSKKEKDKKTTSSKTTKKDSKSNDKEKTKTKKAENSKTKKQSTTPVKRGRKPKVLTEEDELRQVVEMLPKSRRGRKPKK